MGFYLYKGLKKPLVLFGLKGKFIYYAMGSAGAGLVFGMILSFVMGFLGTFLGIIIGGVGFWYMYKIQDKKGLYNKTKNHDEIHMFPNRFNLKKLQSKKQYENEK